MCRACYLRAWRGTELPDGATCATCDERRHMVLRWTRLAGEKIVTCQNCGFLADRLRPRAASLDELKLRMQRERRIGRERRRDYSIDPSDPAERRQHARRARRVPLSTI
jgi:hypothetical protein